MMSTATGAKMICKYIVKETNRKTKNNNVTVL